MKKLSILILSIGLIIGLNSFTYKETNLKINKLDKSIKKLAPPDKWHLFKCVVEDNGTSYYGTKCEVSVWDDCPKAVSCKKLLDDNGDPMPLSVVTQLQSWGFSDEEIKDWKTIEGPFQADNEFVMSHYKFFVATYNQGITYHPDEIIRRNQ